MHARRSFFVIQRRNCRDQTTAVFLLNVGIRAVHDDQSARCPKSKTCIPATLDGGFRLMGVQAQFLCWCQ